MKFLSRVILLFAAQGNSFTSKVALTGSYRKHTKFEAAAPARLSENADGVLYVNDKCITCSACAMFAPDTFSYSQKHGKFIVKEQPIDNESKLENARAAMSACPVAAIRVENSASKKHNNLTPLSKENEELAKSLVLNPKVNGRELPFPRKVPGLEDVPIWHVGYHNHRSFGAVPYLVKGSDGTSVMVDTPKYSPASIRVIDSLCDDGNGPDYLFLSHVDDTADHEKWQSHYPDLKRIFHSGDLGRNNWLNDLELENVEVLLHGETNIEDENTFKAWSIDGTPLPDYNILDKSLNNEFIVLHTPGHSQGSITLLYQSSEGKSAIFTGDTYAYSVRLNSMTGFPRYGNNLKVQSKILNKLSKLEWDSVLPGHGSYKSYAEDITNERIRDVQGAIENLVR